MTPPNTEINPAVTLHQAKTHYRPMLQAVKARGALAISRSRVPIAGPVTGLKPTRPRIAATP